MQTVRQERDKFEGNPLLAEADANLEPSEATLRYMREFWESPAGRKLGQMQTEAFNEQIGEVGMKNLRDQCLKQS